MRTRVPFRAIATGARLFAQLPSFVRSPLASADCRAILNERLERREEIFLSNVGHAVYAHEASPYRELLKIAGCTLGDIQRLVRDDGIEGALGTLYRSGVYLTIDEFKGRKPATRGSAAVTVNPDLLRNPLAQFHLPARSGGSRSGGTPVMMDLAFVRGCGVNSSLVLEARGGGDWLKSTWETPGAGARFRLLKYSSFGAPPVRWFSQLDPEAPGLDPVIRFSATAMRWGGRLGGIALPRPQYVPLSDPLPIAHWMRQSLHSGKTPHVFTFPSSATRLCQAAFDAGIDLTGARFTLGGEPSTKTRLQEIRSSGADGAPRYGSMECGPIGYGCLNPTVPDDVHLQHDLHAVIQPHRGALPSNAVLITSLHPRSPFTMLNVSMGDQATMGTRHCGCSLERLGWKTHLHGIRSFEKFTAGGMTFFDTDIIRVLENDLPAKFGGTATDYQLLEEEAPNGEPRLRLLVHPSLASIDTASVGGTFLDAIASSSVGDQMMASFWRHSGFFSVDRAAPLTTRAGKMLHLHSTRVSS